MPDSLNELESLTDDQLASAYRREIAYHDRLIDSAPMGDERIYFSGKAIDAMRTEMQRRKCAAS